MTLTNGQQPLYAACGNTQAQWPGGGGPGGEDPPVWARAGSIADIDFVNVPPRAWTSTGGEVAWEDFDTILGESSLFGPTTAFDPLMLESGVGYGNGNADRGAGTFLGAMVTAFNFSFTAIAEFNDNFHLEYSVAGFSTDVVVRYADTVEVQLEDAAGGVGLFLPGAPNGDAGPHKFGFTITADSMYAAVDGVSLDDLDEPPSSTLDPDTPLQPTDIYFRAAKLKRLTVYNPIKTEAEQRTLTA